MDFKTFREFHWLTKSVIALTGLFVGLLLIAMIVALIRPNDFAASNGFFMMIRSLGGVLTQAFLVILVIVLISMAVTWIKTWIEKYLDQMLAKLDTLAAQKAERENAGEALAVMNGKMERVEKKLDNIEHILEKVAE
ncbi:MAG: hypothetical protein M0Q91_12275 [Methanoregula sp.]|jgi:hypothetical protein|nr:hypothetical protein [Methanoregula sp.]